MKKLITAVIIGCLFLITGCSATKDTDILSKLDKQILKKDSYALEGKLTIMNNDDSYVYDIKADYKDGDFFKVDLLNTSNNHHQVLLKNTDGVFVLTPSLNKSFKFQSNWPYNNSQSYLMHSIIGDIKLDEKREFEKTKDGYLFTAKVNYPNNKNLVKQRAFFDKDLKPKYVEVLDENGNVQIKMVFTKFTVNKKFDKDHFKLDSSMDTGTDKTKTTSSTIDEIVYPMFMPEGTRLLSQEDLTKELGDRVMLTFGGEKEFMIIEETISYEEGNTVVPVYGEPIIMYNAVGAISENSISFNDGEYEYYIVSDDLEKEELLSVATSLTKAALSK